MSLTDRVVRTLRAAGCASPEQVARRIIADVADDLTARGVQLPTRPLPLPDCPDGCIVGNEWRRQAEHARDLLTEKDRTIRLCAEQLRRQETDDGR